MLGRVLGHLPGLLPYSVSAARDPLFIHLPDSGHPDERIQMISRNLFRIVLVSASLTYGTLAFAATSASAAAKGTGTHQNHHCKQADGTMDMTKTKKACLADKGAWAKDDASAAAPAASEAPKK